MKALFLKIVLLFFTIQNYYLFLGLSSTEGLSLDKLGILQKGIVSFKVQYSMMNKTGATEDTGHGEIFFKENLGLIDDAFINGKRIKRIENFLEGIRLTYNYSENVVYKIDYKTIPISDGLDPMYASFYIWDVLMPFSHNSSINETIISSSSFYVLGLKIIKAVTNRYPIIGTRCVIIQRKKDNFIPYASICNDDRCDKPIFEFEALNVDINPRIEDKDFNLEIPSGFKEIDMTDQFKIEYNIILRLYNLYSINDELQRSRDDLKRVECRLKKELEYVEKEELKQKFSNLGNKAEKIIEEMSIFSPVTKSPSILYIAPGMGFAVIGLGRIDGLEIGDIFQVYHNNELLGKIEISKIYDDMAVAEFVDKESLQRAEVGDKVIKLGSGEF